MVKLQIKTYGLLEPITIVSYRHCGVRNPSWAELQNFVKFLNIQLYDCEESVYCNENIPVVHDVLQGFKPFVVKFMIRMSRVRMLNVL